MAVISRVICRVRSAVALSLVFALWQPGAAQTQAADVIRNQVRDLPVGGAVTVNMLTGEEYYGRIKSIEPDSFSIHEVDLKRDLTLRYEDVKRVRKDYGRKAITGKRIHPHRVLITTLIVVGALLTLVIAAVASDKS